jgi:hypothetical protein
MSSHAARTIAVTIAVVAIGGGAALLAHTMSARSASTDQPTLLTTPGISTPPAMTAVEPAPLPSAPTPSTPANSGAARPSAIETLAPSPTDSRTPAGVSVTVTFSGWNSTSKSFEIGGYANTLETAGTCTVTMTASGATVTRTVPSTPDATTTSCGTLSVPISALTGGSWDAVLSYSSPTSIGTSATVTVEVP